MGLRWGSVCEAMHVYRSYEYALNACFSKRACRFTFGVGQGVIWGKYCDRFERYADLVFPRFGGHSTSKTPGSIPNPAVKCRCADGTAS